MAKKQAHTTFRNGNLFCTHCGRELAVPYPIEIPIFAAMATAFDKSHKNCVKTWTAPVVNPEASVEDRLAFWFNHGERGSSSETIFYRLAKRSNSHYSHPYDPSDFRRCHGLLMMVPELRSNLHKLSDISPAWEALVKNWDKLTTMLEEQLATGKDNGMYDLMCSLTEKK